VNEEQADLDSIDASNAKYKPLTPEQRAKKQATFLRALGKHGVVKVACKAAGISRQTYKNWRDTDAAFKEQLPDTYDERNDTLEYAAYTQAVEGVPSYVVSMGKVVCEEKVLLDKEGKPVLDGKDRPIMIPGKPLIERKYAPSLLIVLLKANMPEKYKDRSEQMVHGTLSTPADRNQMLANMNEQELDQLETLLHAAQERIEHGG